MVYFRVCIISFGFFFEKSYSFFPHKIRGLAGNLWACLSVLESSAFIQIEGCVNVTSSMMAHP